MNGNRIHPTTFQVSSLRPEDLDDLDDEQFRKVIDADLRRRHPKSERDRLPSSVAEALRSDRHIDRWHQELTRIITSVESQMIGRDHDFEKSMATMRRQAMDADTVTRRTIEAEMEDRRAAHHDVQARTTRFGSSVREALVEATELRDRLRGAGFTAVVMAERDHYANQLKRLEAGIHEHKAAVLADLEPTEQVDEIDLRLWSLLEEEP